MQPLERRVLMAAGSYDLSFGGGDGKVATDTPLPVGQVEALPGGGFITPVGAPGELGFARFRPDGSLDTGFGGGDGVVTTTFPAAAARNVIQVGAVPAPGGKVVVFGVGEAGVDGAVRRAMALARFNASGSLDTTFGAGGDDGSGRVTVGPSVPNARPGAAALAPDGGIILMGRVAGGEEDDLYLARLQSDGSRDMAFGGGDGAVVMDEPSEGHTYAVGDLLVGPTGQIAVVGDTSRFHPGIEVHNDLFVYHFSPTGQFQWSARTDVLNGGTIDDNHTGNVSFDYFTGGAFLPDGRVVLGTDVNDGQSPRAAVLYAADGRTARVLDVGPADFNFPHLTAFAAWPDGRFVAAGGGSGGFSLVGFLANGDLDPVYGPPDLGPSGDFTGRNAAATTAVVRPDGKIDVAGPLYSQQPGARPEFGLGRFVGSPTPTAARVELAPDGTLSVVGSEEGDALRVFPHAVEPGREQVLVQFNQQNYFFDRADVARLAIDARGGNDLIDVGRALTIPATLRGGDGDDFIAGGGGRDEFFGGGGNDTVSYEDRATPVFLSLDDVANDGGNRDENIHSDVENLIGGWDDDVLVGSSDANRLEGRGGNDWLRGLGGNDILLGGAGDDILEDTSGTNALGGAGGRDMFNHGIELASAPQDYPAEAAVLSGPVVRFDNQGFQGTGYADFTNAAGDTATFVVDSALEGRYALTFRYANGGQTDRPLNVRVNDRVGQRMSFPSTGGWNQWRTVTVELPLEADPFNQVVVSSIGSNGPNIDTLFVSPGGQEPPPGPQTLQAEDARLVGAVVSRDNAGFDGDGYADFVNRTGDYVEWTVEAAGPGQHRLDFRYANGSASDRTMSVSVNGTVVQGFMLFPPTGSWSTWRTSTIFPLLNGGTNTVLLFATGNSGPNVDSLTVTPEVQPPPGPRTLQAETARLSGVGVGSSNAGYTGGGYADYGSSAGQFIEWTVDAAETRTYVLEFRYANGSSASRPLALKIDGAAPPNIGTPLEFAPTGSWSTWRENGAAVRLTRGTHRIRLTATGQSGPNLDSLTIRPAP